MSAINAVPFDQNAIGDQLALSVKNTILETSVVGTDAHRLARSQFGLGDPKAKGKVEFYICSPDASNPSLLSVSGVPPLCVGLVTAAASLSDFVGFDANGIGYCPGDGKVYANNAVVATFAASSYNSYITVLYDALNATVTWYANGTPLGSATIAAGTWYYAATVSGDPGALAIWANAGQVPAQWPMTVLGWFHLGTGLDPTFVANEPYIAGAADVRPNQRYAGDLDRGSTRISIARSITPPWFFGPSKPSSVGGNTSIQIPLLDPNKIYEQFTTTDVRDQIVQLWRNTQGAAFSSAESLFVGIIDRCEQQTDQTKVLYANGKMALLQGQLIRPLFPPNADQTLAGKPWPFREGINRNYSPTAYDTTNLLFPATSTPVSGIGKIRDQGVELAYGIDVSLTADGRSFSRTAPPKGKTLYETTTFGGSYSPSVTDLLAGDGVFGSTADSGGGKTATSSTSLAVATGSKAFNVGAGKHFSNGSLVTATSRGSGEFMSGTVTSYANPTLTINVTSVSGSGTHSDWDITGGVNQPANWIGGGGYLGSDPVNTIWQVKGTAPNEYVEQQQQADAVYWMQHATLTIAAGAFVAYEIVVKQAPWFGMTKDTNGKPLATTPAQLVIGGDPTQNIQFAPWAKFSIPTATTYRGSFVNTMSITQPLVLGFLCNALIQGTGGVFSYLQLSSFKLIALPAITQNVLLLGPGLDWMLQRLFIQFGPLSLDDYDSSGAVAIDTDTGYQCGLAYSENETPSCASAAQPLLDSFGASLYETRAGEIGTFRLTPPEDATAIAGTLTVTNFSGYLIPTEDLAENLSSRAVGTRNVNPCTDSDFANVSLSQVPQIVRNLLKASFQTSCVAGVVLAGKYSAYANNAAPLQTCLDLAADVQAEITRVNSLYVSPRHFYVGTVFSPPGTLYEIGQVWNVIYPTGVLTAGQQLVIIAVDEQPTEELTTLTFWGL